MDADKDYKDEIISKKLFIRLTFKAVIIYHSCKTCCLIWGDSDMMGEKCHIHMRVPKYAMVEEWVQGLEWG